MQTDRLVLILAWAIAIFALMAGCTSDIDPATQAQIHAQTQTTALKVATIQAADKVATAQAAANPILHPIKAASATTKELHAPLVWIVLLSFLVCAASVGLLFTSFSFVSKIAVPVAGVVCIASLAGLIALPFVPLAMAIALGLLFGAFIYELVRRKGNFAAIESDVDSLFPALKISEAIASATGAATTVSSAVQKIETTVTAAITPATPATPPAAPATPPA